MFTFLTALLLATGVLAEQSVLTPATQMPVRTGPTPTGGYSLFAPPTAAQKALLEAPLVRQSILCELFKS